MRKLILLCTSLCAMVLLISASPVQAQNTLWVSATGNDSNACITVAPCATFQGAINRDPTHVRQINCLTSGSYGAFTITASITVDCGTGNVGNVVVSSGFAITINTPSPATIVLRHLNLNGLGTAGFGIRPTAFHSGTMIVDNCIIQGFVSGNGINFLPHDGRGLLQVSNSQIFGNFNGIVVAPSEGQIASVTLNRVELVGNSQHGLSLSTGIVAGTMRDSVAGANGISGVTSSATQAFFTVEQSSIVANLATGVQTTSAGTVINVGGSTIGGNGTGVKAFSGSLVSFGNNQFSANGTDGTFTSTKLLK